MRFRSICIYCGSSPGFDPRHTEVARDVGALLAASSIQLVYGGASVGVMGALADAALAAGGTVVGAFVALPGGLGTLEELAEVATWAQLGIHAKPVAVVDAFGFWRPLLEFLDGAVAEGFLSERSRRLIVRVGRVGELLETLDRYKAPPAEGALTAEEI